MRKSLITCATVVVLVVLYQTLGDTARDVFVGFLIGWCAASLNDLLGDLLS